MPGDTIQHYILGFGISDWTCILYVQKKERSGSSTNWRTK
jgi:hypothetical protein